jgi:hypothetical protein
MLNDVVAMLQVGVERVGIVAQGRDIEPLVRQHPVDLRSLARRQCLHVDVNDPAVLAISAFAGRPAAQLQHLEPVVRRPCRHFLQRHLRERCTHDTNLHRHVLL